MRHLSICILGGTGFIGTRLAARLLDEGHQVTVLSRDREQHKHLRVLPGLTLENCNVYDPAALAERFRGQAVVINLVGILNERGFGGVTRLLQMSSLGASSTAPSYYLRSKGEAERLIQSDAGNVDWTIFKPSVIFGPGDSFLNRFARLLASLPLVFPLAKPNARLQPVFVDDVIAAFLRCLHGGATSRQVYELGGPQQYTLREIVAFVAKITRRRRLIIGLPDFVARFQALVMDFVPGRPFSSDNYRSLTIDSVCREDGFARLGIQPQSMTGAARLYLGRDEDNARLSRDRAAVGRTPGGPY
jgi:NADH dehydrogenase